MVHHLVSHLFHVHDPSHSARLVAHRAAYHHHHHHPHHADLVEEGFAEVAVAAEAVQVLLVLLQVVAVAEEQVVAVAEEGSNRPVGQWAVVAHSQMFGESSGRRCDTRPARALACLCDGASWSVRHHKDAPAAAHQDDATSQPTALGRQCGALSHTPQLSWQTHLEEPSFGEVARESHGNTSAEPPRLAHRRRASLRLHAAIRSTAQS